MRPHQPYVNAALLLAFGAAILNTALGTVLLGLSRAPGWGRARTFAFVAVTAALYNAGNIVIASPGSSDGVAMWAARWNFLIAALHIAGWLVYAFGGDSGSLRQMTPRLRALTAGTVASGFLVFAVPSLIFQPGQYRTLTIGWAGVSYHEPLTTIPGEIYGALLVTVLVLPFVAVWRGRRRNEDAASAHLIGFGLLFACAVLELLVVNGMVAFPYLLDIGFVAAVTPVALDTMRRFRADAERLATVSAKLTNEVALRTEERDIASDAVRESERQSALGRLAAGVGHEINNPLTYITLDLELVENWARQANAPEEVRAALRKTWEGADRIRHAVEGLRKAARAEAAELPAVSLGDVARSAVRVAAPKLRQVTHVLVDVEDSPYVLGDQAKLVQAVVNILANAVVTIAEHEGATERSVSIRTASLPHGSASIEVRDEGPGIGVEVMERLAQPYFTTHRRSDGTGLGLCLSQQIAERHGGWLEFSSIVGKGSVVRLVLPAIVSPTVEQIAAATSRASAATPPKGAPVVNPPVAPPVADRRADTRARVLVVDDDAQVARVLCRGLVAANFDVRIALGGVEALRIIESEGAFDAVVSDLMMPGMSGMEFADQLASRQPALRSRTLFVTGGAMLPAAESFLARPDVRYLLKPLQLKSLVAALEELLGVSAGGPTSR